jgi:enoyl-CoA hydratase/carnithine racemase
MLTGRRYGGPDALAAGIVAEVAPEGAVVERAVVRAQALAGKSRSAVSAIKRGLYGAPVALLDPGQTA